DSRGPWSELWARWAYNGRDKNSSRSKTTRSPAETLLSTIFMPHTPASRVRRPMFGDYWSTSFGRSGAFFFSSSICFSVSSLYGLLGPFFRTARRQSWASAYLPGSRHVWPASDVRSRSKTDYRPLEARLQQPFQVGERLARNKN